MTLFPRSPEASMVSVNPALGVRGKLLLYCIFL